jgi:hypothetical protein
MGPEAASALETLEVWSCQEKGGFVWMFFGDKDTPMDARPAIPWVPELNKPGKLPATRHSAAIAHPLHASLQPSLDLLSIACGQRVCLQRSRNLSMQACSCSMHAGWTHVHGEVFIKANHWMVMENVSGASSVMFC